MKIIFWTMILFFASSISFARNSEEKQDSRIAGYYQVPVTDERLKPFATFAIEIKQQIRKDELITKYDIPLELAGEEKEITIKGSTAQGAPPLQGELSTGTCTDKVEQQDCTMVYNADFKLNELATISYLNSRNFPPDELQFRLQVAREFSGNPIGILIIPKN